MNKEPLYLDALGMEFRQRLRAGGAGVLGCAAGARRRGRPELCLRKRSTSESHLF
jgi:hypothetical protein